MKQGKPRRMKRAETYDEFLEKKKKKRDYNERERLNIEREKETQLAFNKEKDNKDATGKYLMM